MTPHDRWLEPDEEPERPLHECEFYSGNGASARMTMGGWEEMECPECEGSGQVEMTDEELAQKQFDDFDPHDNDFGELL